MANFTPQEIEQFLQEFFDVVGARQYVGARYVPIFGRAGEDTVEWDNGAPYEPLTVVMHLGVSYVSRQYVPAGTPITDTDFWVETYRFNAQVEQYRQEVLGFQSQIDQIREDMEADYVPFPDPDTYPKYGILGQVLTTLTGGETKWEDPVTVTADVAEPLIEDWLDAHPEATTTVQDGAVTNVKLGNDTFKRRTTADYDPDLNAMIDAGFYGLNGGATTYANAPTEYAMAEGGVLITFKYYPNTDFVSQILINFGKSGKRKMFYRSGNPTTTNPGFTDWRVVETTDIVDDKIDATITRRNTSDYNPDFNAMIDAGFYGLGDGTTYANAPTEYAMTEGGVLITFKYYPNTDFVSQILINFGKSGKRKMFYRSGNPTTTNPGFTDWCVVEDTGEILSTVDSKIDAAVTFGRRTTSDYDPDFNSMLDAGFYGLAGGTTYANAPADFVTSEGGVLITFRYYPNATFVSQILINYSPTTKRKMFYRSGNPGGPVPGFTDWCVVETEDSVDSKINTAVTFGRRTTSDYGKDFNSMLDAGFYGLTDTTYANAPTDFVSDGGCLVTFRYYQSATFVSQLLFNYGTRPNKVWNLYFRSGHGTNGWQPWAKINPDYPSLIEANKIALFGDSIMSGTIKTPSSVQTHCVGKYLQQGLKIPVVDGSVGSIGYITHAYLSYNILELVKAVDLSGCKTFVCSAGDNDYQYPIGTYTDTNAGYNDYEASDSGATIMGNVYKLVDYLHTTYPNMSVIIASKTNVTNNGTWPTYRRDITTLVGQINAELKKFADYYGCGWIDLSSCGMDAWLLDEVLEPDQVHFKDIGYQRVAAYMVGELIKYTGIGNYIDNTVPRLTYPSQG